MEKGFVLFFLFVFISSMSFVFAQQNIYDQVPGGDIVQNAVDEDGNVKGVEGIKSTIDSLREESDTSYLFNEWTKIPYIGGIFSFTEGFFSFFNFLWKYSFGIEFSWTLIFFLHVFVWLFLVLVIYFLAKEIFNGSLFAILTGVIFASITGSFRIISRFVVFIETAFGDLRWLTFIFLLVLVVIVVIEKSGIDWMKKESQEEELKRADQKRLSAGKIAGKMLDDIGSQEEDWI